MTVTILAGDARAVLRTLASESVQMVCTSPPYFGLRHYGADGQLGVEPTPADFIAALVAVFDEVHRVLSSDGLCFVNIGDSYSGSRTGPTAKNLLLIPQRFAIAMQGQGWIVRSEIVWAKQNPMPEPVRDRPSSAWEPIWMFAKSPRYVYDQEAVREPFARARQPEAKHWARNGADALTGQARNGTSQQGLSRYSTDGKVGANLRNVWLLSSEPSREQHYAAFPTELARRCILAGSRSGDTVLDPFLGSGTTALVADRLGRHAIGVEVNEQYVEMARQRIESDEALFAEPVAVRRPVQAAFWEEE